MYKVYMENDISHYKRIFNKLICKISGVIAEWEICEKSKENKI